MDAEIYDKLKQLAGAENVKAGELMSAHTTFQIGGPADFFVTPKTVEEIQMIVKFLIKEKIAYYIIGNGSNLLVGDKGIRGVILKLGQCFSKEEIVEDSDTVLRIRAQSGIYLSKLSRTVGNFGGKGFEFASGIPGCLGGAVTMNAGAYGGEIKDSIVKATVMDQNGEIILLTKEQLELGYRTSILSKKGFILLDAEFEFEKGSKADIAEKMALLAAQRKEKQPLEYPSAGSTFKRPEGYFAGKLIMDAGLKGFQIGKAKVAEKHCGFVINTGGAKASEVMELLKEVDRIVFEKFQVHLEPEVRFLGEF